MRFVDRVGVCLHTSAQGYADIGAVQSALDWLGVSHYRDRGTRGLTGLTGKVGHIIAQNAAEATAAVAAGAATIEGPNEPNTQSSGDLAANAAVWEQIVTAVDGAVPTLTSAMNQGQPWTSPPLPADYGNVHAYRGAATLTDFTTKVQAALATQHALVGFRPWIASETGWHNDPGGFGQVTPDQAADALVETLTVFWQAGAERVHLYELVDEPYAAKGHQQFGLFTPDWQPKPIATALQAFLAQCGQLDDLTALTVDPQLAVAQQNVQDLTGQLAAAQQATADAQAAQQTAVTQYDNLRDALKVLTSAAQ